jgi:hypothetical protein
MAMSMTMADFARLACLRSSPNNLTPHTKSQGHGTFSLSRVFEASMTKNNSNWWLSIELIDRLQTRLNFSYPEYANRVRSLRKLGERSTLEVIVNLRAQILNFQWYSPRKIYSSFAEVLSSRLKCLLRQGSTTIPGGFQDFQLELEGSEELSSFKILGYY